MPPGFQDGVWRRIERLETAEAGAGSGWLARVAGLIVQPRFAGALAGVMLLVGAGIGVLQGTEAVHQAAQARYLELVAPAYYVR
jgi:hypothetical protein